MLVPAGDVYEVLVTGVQVVDPAVPRAVAGQVLLTTQLAA